ncbi:unnamed protein product [Vitrella brassicaformis CCMP3155]|uniref:SEA domain-containing protein n=1 Tax=Vitrella brassicaformis (strain CCMP3155) TaxID=1169540 RepID=A0A0G4EK12_VITBC|nr:unnamed protein product [Vitrella brassicaformis CCMP3155]|eukprot:CEL97770.1 unnamed protein product [Vitrella brassicaformis CCMP3155]
MFVNALGTLLWASVSLGAASGVWAAGPQSVRGLTEPQDARMARVLTMRIVDRDYHDVTKSAKAYKRFAKELENAVARSLGLIPSEVFLRDVKPGSVIAAIEIPSGPHQERFDDFLSIYRSVMSDPQSLLRQAFMVDKTFPLTMTLPAFWDDDPRYFPRPTPRLPTPKQQIAALPPQAVEDTPESRPVHCNIGHEWGQANGSSDCGSTRAGSGNGSGRTERNVMLRTVGVRSEEAEWREDSAGNAHNGSGETRERDESSAVVEGREREEDSTIDVRVTDESLEITTEPTRNEDTARGNENNKRDKGGVQQQEKQKHHALMQPVATANRTETAPFPSLPPKADNHKVPKPSTDHHRRSSSKEEGPPGGIPFWFYPIVVVVFVGLLLCYLSLHMFYHRREVQRAAAAAAEQPAFTGASQCPARVQCHHCGAASKPSKSANTGGLFFCGLHKARPSRTKRLTGLPRDPPLYCVSGEQSSRVKTVSTIATPASSRRADLDEMSTASMRQPAPRLPFLPARSESSISALMSSGAWTDAHTGSARARDEWHSRSRTRHVGWRSPQETTASRTCHMGPKTSNELVSPFGQASPEPVSLPPSRMGSRSIGWDRGGGCGRSRSTEEFPELCWVPQEKW